MKNLLSLITIGFFIGFSNHTFASDNYRFRTLSMNGGLSYDGVQSIKQDQIGCVWLMMENDLYRFDGYQFKRYYTYFTDLDHTVEWLFNNMAENSRGDLYISTNQGIYIHDSYSDTFSPYYIKKDIGSIVFDKNDNLWIRCENQWNIFDQNTKTLKKIAPRDNSVTNINSVFCSTETDVYLFNNLGNVYRYNSSIGELKVCLKLFDNNKCSVVDAKIYNNKLWILVDKYGLYKIDVLTYKIEEHYNCCQEGEIGAPIRTFLIDKNGKIWLGTFNGLYTLDPDVRVYKRYYYTPSDPFSIPNNSIWSINQDRQKNLWFGTYAGNICYLNLDENRAFNTYFPKEGMLNHVPVSAFVENENYLWIGTEGGGISQMDKKSNQFIYYKNEIDAKKTSFYNNVKSLQLDNNNNLWVATFNGGLNFFDSREKKITAYMPDNKDKSSILYAGLRKIILESDSGLWVVYQNKKEVLSYFSFKTKKFEHFMSPNENRENHILDILRGRDNQLWAITNSQLFRIDVRDKKIEVIVANDSAFLNLHSLCLDFSGNIWIGTIGNGLVKYDQNTNKMTIHKEILYNGITSVHSMNLDDLGNLWLGTDNGLVRYDPQSGAHSVYYASDGTQGQLYYPLSTYRNKDGDLYFGGTSGFTIVKPHLIQKNDFKPRIIISDFMVDNHSVKLRDLITKQRDEQVVINLSYKQANFGFMFSSDNFYISEKNRFKYRLKGYDNKWIETDADNRTAYYTKVPAGKYVFEIMSANNDGVWNEQPYSITVKIQPAPWLSWWAYIVYAGFLGMIFYFILVYFYQKRKIKMQIYLDQIEKDKKEQIHQTQLRFFTNVSHDFRTPLSLIIATLGKLKDDGLKEYYYNILNNNAQRLLGLVNDLMDFRTIQNEKMSLKVKKTNVNDFIKRMAFDFSHYARQHDINFRVNIDEKLSDNIYIDTGIVEKIVMNLLQNSFRYTHDGGQIIIETYGNANDPISDYQSGFAIKNEQEAPSKFAIVVRDTGVGISENSISSVFDRFYKVNTMNQDKHLGTGIGLALVKGLVLLHKGDLKIFSEQGKGTDLIICLPIGVSAYNENEIFLDKRMSNKELLKKKNSGTKDDVNLTPQKMIFRKKILIAEDNEDLRTIIADFLSQEYEVCEATDGLKASELIDKNIFDLIISDIMMPEKDGISLCRELKNDITTSHIPVILLTAKVGLENKIEGVDSGADFYLEKPIDLTLLKLTIQNIFKQIDQLKEYFGKNYYIEKAELALNEQDNRFLKRLIEVIELNIEKSDLDVNTIAKELSMSRSKLYNVVKSLTDKSIVEFLLGYRMQKAAKLMTETDMNMREVMSHVGIESQSYFTNAFKKEFGETPTAFANKFRKKE